MFCFGEKATIHFLAFRAVCFPLGMMDPLDPLRRISGFAYMDCPRASFIVHLFFSFSRSKNLPFYHPQGEINGM